MLLDIGELKSRAGTLIVSAALFDDILGLILLAVLTALLETGDFPRWLGILGFLFRVILFFGLCAVLGLYVFPWIAKLFRRSLIEEMQFSFLLVGGLGFAVLAELLHLHFILGAFLADLFFTRSSFGKEKFHSVEAKVTAVSTGFLAPLFFASIGFHLDPSAVFEIPWFVVLLVFLAIASKFIGAGLPALWIGLKRREAAEVGIGMSARGAVELIIADIALRAGLFTQPEPVPPIVSSMFSAVVIMAMVTTFVMPIGMRLLVGNKD